MRNKHYIPWNMARNTQKGDNDECTLQDLEYGEKTEKCTQQDLEMGRETEKVENEKHTLQDLEYGKKTDQQEK